MNKTKCLGYILIFLLLSCNFKLAKSQVTHYCIETIKKTCPQTPDHLARMISEDIYLHILDNCFYFSVANDSITSGSKLIESEKFFLEKDHEFIYIYTKNEEGYSLKKNYSLN